ncbi:MAG: 5-(carboxyamino)imidazole ribonucleotide synthase [Myxococcota bacterium]
MKPIWPGATIGIIGGGQLGRMIALEAKRMGYRIAVLDPDADGPAAQVADIHIAGALNNVEAARELADCSDVVTIDSEHVPADLLRELESHTEVRPSADVLEVVQDRLQQRRFLEMNGLPQVRHASVSSIADLENAASKVGFPAVLKTRREGYDGKGQVRVESHAELIEAWDRLGRVPAMLEAFAHFDKEISAILARGLDGEIRFFTVAENKHRQHILHITHAPASISPSLATRANEIGARIATALGHVGMIAVELFVMNDDHLLVNEIAPRTHNSGHYTFGGCATSHFEQHVRAICGLGLGSPSLLRPAVMLNLLGEHWRDGEPSWSDLLAHPSAQLHIYGKKKASIGRKMGHVLVLDDEMKRAQEIVESIVQRLDSCEKPSPGRIVNTKTCQ